MRARFPQPGRAVVRREPWHPVHWRPV